MMGLVEGLGTLHLADEYIARALHLIERERERVRELEGDARKPTR